ncbi:hypothetical protein V8C35DRAFT_333148 [Trichoderma chlorosporum]
MEIEGLYNPFPDIPELGITIKVNAILLEAYDYYVQKMDKSVVDHCVRSMYWAVLLSRHKKFEGQKFNWDVVFLAVLMHDFGLSTDKSLISDDKRFEVDGADITRKFLEERGGDAWAEHLQLVWDAIALHTTASIAHYKEPEVVLTSFAVMVDMFGPNFPGDMLSKSDYLVVAKRFPRPGFKDQVIGTMCTMCKEKPTVTFDNFVQEFGRSFGYDGKGQGKEEFARLADENKFSSTVLAGLNGLDEMEMQDINPSC